MVPLQTEKRTHQQIDNNLARFFFYLTSPFIKLTGWKFLVVCWNKSGEKGQRHCFGESKYLTVNCFLKLSQIHAHCALKKIFSETYPSSGQELFLFFLIQNILQKFHTMHLALPNYGAQIAN